MPSFRSVIKLQKFFNCKNVANLIQNYILSCKIFRKILQIQWNTILSLNRFKFWGSLYPVRKRQKKLFFLQILQLKLWFWRKSATFFKLIFLQLKFADQTMWRDPKHTMFFFKYFMVILMNYVVFLKIRLQVHLPNFFPISICQ